MSYLILLHMKKMIHSNFLFLSLQSYAELSDGLYAKMRTNQGNIIIKLAFDKAPLTVSNYYE
jgi:hypothetical protein